MTTIRERLKGRLPESPKELDAEEPPPNDTVETQKQHAGSTHNAIRRQVDMVSFFYGTEGERALPYAYLLDIDRPTPQEISVQFSTCTVVIKGLRLTPVMVALKNHTLSELKADTSSANATGTEPCIQKISIKNRD